jgi:hypothetical protein
VRHKKWIEKRDKRSERASDVVVFSLTDDSNAIRSYSELSASWKGRGMVVLTS